jgi:hypothetical protein
VWEVLSKTDFDIQKIIDTKLGQLFEMFKINEIKAASFELPYLQI